MYGASADIRSNGGIGSGKCIPFQNQNLPSSSWRPFLAEQHIVRVHVLPALGAGRRLDVEWADVLLARGVTH